MARTQVAAVLIGAALLVGAGAGLNFEVAVQPSIGTQFIDFTQTEDGSLRSFSVSATNTGSVTCVFRMKAELERANQTITRYSPGQVLYPGEEQRLELAYLPYNYTGDVSGRAWVQFCDRQQRVGNVSFTVDERLTANRSLDARTLRAGNHSARISVDAADGLLLPQEAPGFWRPSAAPVRNGTAVVRYDPPVFDSSERLTYLVYDQEAGEILGTTEVMLTEQLTLLEQLARHRVLVGLAASVLLNLVLLAILVRGRRE